jgi:hypothetical protein
MIVYFFHDSNNIAGRHLGGQFFEHPRRQPDWLLRWHYKQAILTNVKGGGKPDSSIKT